LAQAVEAYLNVLDQYTLLDIVSNRDELVALLPDFSISVLQLD
ncbi:MAG: BadM/Rrf2 family transcriptional regulator, partial [Shewanella oncorhynchi]